MMYGVLMFATDYAIRVDDLARAAEERGFESLWLQIGRASCRERVYSNV